MPGRIKSREGLSGKALLEFQHYDEKLDMKQIGRDEYKNVGQEDSQDVYRQIYNGRLSEEAMPYLRILYPICRGVIPKSLAAAA